MGYKPNIRHLQVCYQPIDPFTIDPVFQQDISYVSSYYSHPPHLKGMKFGHLEAGLGTVLLRLGNYLLLGGGFNFFLIFTPSSGNDPL